MSSAPPARCRAWSRTITEIERNVAHPHLETTMNSRRAMLFVLFLVSVALAGCGSKGSGGGSARIRVLNAIPDANSISLTIDTNAPIVSGLAFQQTTQYTGVDTGAQTFSDQTMSDIVAITKGSAQLVNVGVLKIDETGTGQVFQNLLAEFKVINATSVASPLNVAVDGTLTLSNIPYTGVSNYTITTAGSHSFTVQATATPGANLLTLVNTLAPATDTSFVLVGPAGALSALALQDNNLPPPVGHSRLRFVNAASGLPSLDVYVNFSKQVSNLTTNSASGYIDVTADTTSGTVFEFDFNTAGTVTAVLKVPNVTITGGRTYTVYVVGTAAAPVGVVTKDD